MSWEESGEWRVTVGIRFQEYRIVPPIFALSRYNGIFLLAYQTSVVGLFHLGTLCMSGRFLQRSKWMIVGLFVPGCDSCHVNDLD